MTTVPAALNITGLHPGGSLQVFSNPTRLRWAQQPCKLVLHTVEGGTYPTALTYDNGRRAPHVTANPWDMTWRQHYPFTEAAWALRADGTSTNTMGAIQVEIVGTCDRSSKYAIKQYVPGLTGDRLEWLLGLLKMLCRRAGIPWQCTVPWVAYPASYGTGAPQRLTVAQWQAYRGILGHQHVPGGNSHGDPGALPASWFGATTPAPAPAPAELPAVKEAPKVFIFTTSDGRAFRVADGQPVTQVDDLVSHRAIGVPVLAEGVNAGVAYAAIAEINNAAARSVAAIASAVPTAPGAAVVDPDALAAAILDRFAARIGG